VIGISRRGARRVTWELLRDAPVVCITDEEYRRLVVRRWKEMPRRRMLRSLLLMFAPVVLITGVAVGESRMPPGNAPRPLDWPC
jgi:hypothetical protein